MDLAILAAVIGRQETMFCEIADTACGRHVHDYIWSRNNRETEKCHQNPATPIADIVWSRFLISKTVHTNSLRLIITATLTRTGNVVGRSSVGKLACRADDRSSTSNFEGRSHVEAQKNVCCVV